MAPGVQIDWPIDETQAWADLLVSLYRFGLMYFVSLKFGRAKCGQWWQHTIIETACLVSIQLTAQAHCLNQYYGSDINW